MLLDRYITQVADQIYHTLGVVPTEDENHCVKVVIKATYNNVHLQDVAFRSFQAQMIYEMVKPQEARLGMMLEKLKQMADTLLVGWQRYTEKAQEERDARIAEMKQKAQAWVDENDVAGREQLVGNVPSGITADEME
jgi:hypothetical protein